jgi:hypothetical protein
MRTAARHDELAKEDRMDDIVGRLLRELPHTDKDRYDIAFARGRAQARSSLVFSGLAVGLAVGSAAMFLLDPQLGRGRRVDLRERIAGAVNQLRETLAARRRDLAREPTPPSDAEPPAVEATTPWRTPPRSAVAPRTARASGTDREPVAAGAAEP